MIMVNRGGQLKQAVKNHERKDETRQEGLDQNLKEEPKNKILL